MHLEARPDRSYDQLSSVMLRPMASRDAAMNLFVETAWRSLSSKGVSWIGFYTANPGDAQMILGPSRNKPACSPIGMHGACGRVFQSSRPLVVRDVANLGEGYIACDPNDRSEVVIPLLDGSGEAWGVLDADSFEADAFDQRDVEGLADALRAGGLIHPGADFAGETEFA